MQARTIMPHIKEKYYRKHCSLPNSTVLQSFCCVMSCWVTESPINPPFACAMPIQSKLNCWIHFKIWSWAIFWAYTYLASFWKIILVGPQLKTFPVSFTEPLWICIRYCILAVQRKMSFFHFICSIIILWKRLEGTESISLNSTQLAGTIRIFTC